MEVNLTAHTVEELQSGKHALRKGLLGTLATQIARSTPWIGEDPLENIRTREQPLLEDVDDYLTTQQHFLAIAAVHGASLNPETTLEQALNSPHRVGRKTIDALEIEGILPKTLKSMNKDDIAQAVSEVYGSRDPQIVPLQDHLRADLARYDKLFMAIQEGILCLDANQYKQIIEETAAEDAVIATDFIIRIQAIYRSLINQGRLAL